MLRMQVLGLTNYSRDPQATELRNCIVNDHQAAELALEYAIQRLKTFAHVGTFEAMRESLSSFASRIGKNLSDLAWSSNKMHAFSYDEGDEDDPVWFWLALVASACE
jgi:hypothetical protein